MTKFLWCDTETTGLDPEKDLLLELGFIVTDTYLNPLAQFSRVIGQSPADLVRMDLYVREMHSKNGLASECLAVFEKDGWNIAAVEKEALDFVTEHFPVLWRVSDDPKVLPKRVDVKPSLFGNTVTFDLSFLKRHMPTLADCFGYRTCDVSALKPLAKEWFGFEVPKPDYANAAHRVVTDLHASIEELQSYRERIFKVLDE